MNLPHDRIWITVRRPMIAVAIAAVLIWAGVEGERRRQHDTRPARQHAIVRDEMPKFLAIVPPSSKDDL